MKTVAIGTIGNFYNRKGESCACVVRGNDGELLTVDYVMPETGIVIKDAIIGVEDFETNSVYQPLLP